MIASSAQSKASSHQQTSFSAEDSSVERPVPIPTDVMQALSQDKTVKAVLENSDEPLKAPAASWFLASYIDLQEKGSQDLIVIAQPPVSGANVTLFWIFRHSGSACKMVMSAAPAHNLIVKSGRSHGMRSIELQSATAVQWSSTLCKYDGTVYVTDKSRSAPIN